MSRITTLWTLHLQAHAPEAGAGSRGELLYRYRAAAYRYVIAAVRDEDAADDLVQEFAVRFLRGDFRHADPGRGRFRDYIRTALSHLVNDHRRAGQNAPAQLTTEPAAPSADEADSTFHAAWRDELLERTWNALAVEQPTGCAVLRLRVEERELTSNQMAERLTVTLGRPQTAEGVRKALQRAHERFAELLLGEVEVTLERPTVEELEAELQELGLSRYCRSALARRSL